MAEPSVVDMSLDGPIHREAFERCKEEIRAVPLDQLATVNVEPFQAVTTTLRSLPAVRAWRARLVKEFTSFEAANLDKLGDYAMAYFHTVVADQAQSPLASEVEKLQGECAALCSVLDADLRPLVERGIINGAPLKERKGVVGYRNTAGDLLLLTELCRNNWAKLEGKTYITLQELRNAEAKAAKLTAAVAERERVPDPNSEVSLDKQRAFTLFARAHAKVRRGIAFLLEEEGRLDELNETMPSIHVGRASGNGKKKLEGEPEKPPQAGAGDVVANVVAAQRANPGAGGRVGMPDSDPFTSQ